MFYSKSQGSPHVQNKFMGISRKVPKSTKCTWLLQKSESDIPGLLATIVFNSNIIPP